MTTGKTIALTIEATHAVKPPAMCLPQQTVNCKINVSPNFISDSHFYLLIFWWKCYSLEYNAIALNEKKNNKPRTYMFFSNKCLFKGQVSLPSWLISKESTWQCRRRSLIPELGRSPGEGKGNPLQYSCLGNPTDRGTCQEEHAKQQCSSMTIHVIGNMEK